MDTLFVSFVVCLIIAPFYYMAFTYMMSVGGMSGFRAFCYKLFEVFIILMILFAALTVAQYCILILGG